MKELNVGIVACASMQEQVKECLASLESSFRIYPIVPSCTFSVNIDLFRHYLDRSTSENDVTLLAYGICHPQILTLLAEYGDRVVKVEGSNCYEMFLGSEKYSEYHRKCYWMLNKPFFTRWRNEILTGFGAGTSNGRTLIGDAFKKLVYLRFENDELSIDVVEDFARAVGLEYEIYSVDTANLKRLLEEALASAYSTARVKVPKSSVSYPHQSEMRTLVESIGEVIYKVDVNTKQFTFVSAQVKTILGYTPSEFLGIVNDHPRAPLYHEDDRQRVVAGRYKFLVKCLSEGMQEPYEAEYRAKHKNGDVLWVKECIYPSYSSDGVIESFVGKIADITEPKRVEQALRESGKRFRALTESTSDWIWEVNVDGVYTYAGPKVKDMLGYEPEEVIGKTPFDLMPPEEAKRIADEFRAIVESQRPFARLENINLHKDGRLVVLETSGVPFFNFDGQLGGYRGIDRDITERKRVEHDLNERAKELNCLYGIAQTAESPNITLDELYQETTNLLPASWQYPEITCARITINGKKFETENFGDTEWKQSSDIKVDGAKVGVVEVYYLEERLEIDEGPFQKEERLLIDAVAQQLGRVTERKRAEEVLRQAHLELERRVEERTAELVKANEVLQIEITERKRAEEALQESEQKYRCLFEQLNDAAFLVDVETGRILDTNKQGEILVGRTREEIIGMRQSEFHPPGKANEYRQRLAARIKKGCAVNFDGEAIRKDGSLVPVNISAAPVTIGGKRLLIGLFRDITERKRAEEELLEQRDRAQKYLNIAGVMLIVINADQKVMLVNNKGCQILGCEEREIIGKNWFNTFVPERNRDKVKLVFGKLMAGEAEPAEYFENPVLTKSGEERTIAWHNAVLKDKEGKIIATLSSGEDITERKRMEEELRESQQNFRNSLDSSPLGVRIITADGDLLYANQAMLDIYGYSSVEELKAIPAKQRYTPESYAEHRERKEKRKLGKPVPSNYEISIVRKNGEIRRLVVFRKAVVWGGEVQFQALYQDITERKRVESALRQSEEFNSSLFLNSPNPILVLNSDASIRYVNPALEKLTGFTSAELVGRFPPFPWWIEGTYKKNHRNMAIAMCRTNGKCEQLFGTKNGQQFWVEVNFKTVELNGEFKYNLSNWVDLTERKRLRENMEFYISQITRAQEEERKRIAREIHDEWVQSLAVLALHIDAMAADTGKLPENVIERIRGLRAETDTILEGLRRFSHELRPGVIDQIGLVPALEILNEELNKEIGISARLEVTGPERRLTAEIELVLFRIAQEALRNVRRHSKATGAVIRLKFIRRKVKLAVSDNGRGFELPEMLSDLAAEGKLGLIGMQERARLLDGKLLVKSRVGRGTRIVIEVET